MKRKINIIGFTLFFTLALFSLAFSEESITITTYYPSPYGSYNELTTTGNTYLATTSGKVGIGTTSPGQKLDVVGYTATNGLALSRDNTNRYGLFLATAGDFNHVLYNDYSNIDGEGSWDGAKWNVYSGLNVRVGPSKTSTLFINSSGNVGIGTASPAAKLDVAGILALNDNELRVRAGGDTCHVMGWSSSPNRIFIKSCNSPVVLQESVGNVGIGTAGPSAKLQISKDNGSNGAAGLSDYEMVTTASGGQATLGAEYIGDGYANLNLGSNISGARRFWHISKRLSTNANPHCMEIYFYSGGFAGPLFTFTTGGNFTATGTKSFEIDHPTKPGMKLVHASVEGPEAGVYYRGETKLIKGQATVKLPDYFEALTRKEERTVQLTAKGREPFLLSTTGVSNGQFKIFGNKPDGEFYWEVKAVRVDVEPLRVEKPREQGTG